MPAAGHALGLLTGNEAKSGTIRSNQTALVNLIFRFRVNPVEALHTHEKPLGGLNQHEHCHDRPRHP